MLSNNGTGTAFGQISYYLEFSKPGDAKPLSLRIDVAGPAVRYVRCVQHGKLPGAENTQLRGFDSLEIVKRALSHPAANLRLL